MYKKSSLFRGFTLIELLIVVAIIAILAAIAVPNFIEAQIRSKVSRAKTDMRSLATAMEAYMTDQGTYNPFRFSGPSGMVGYGLTGLTTPVAYITSLPKDPFQQAAQGVTTAQQVLEFANSFEVTTGSTKALPGSGGRGTANNPVEKDWVPWPKDMFLMTSMGPDRTDTTSTQRFPATFGQMGEGYVACEVYDSSNGSVSRGEIFRYVCPARYGIIFEVGYDPANNVDPTAGAYPTWRTP